MTLATGETTRTAVITGRLERETVLSWAGLFFALAVSAVLNLWNLAQNGYGNEYYAVAVQSMIQNFHNFFYGSYDAGGFITVDKPPVALWVEAISARIFGFSGLAILVPEALLGVATVGLVFFLVKRHFGSLAAFVAALAMAFTPIAVAVQRSNNTDTMLMFTLVLAAWAMTLATEKGRLGLLLLAMALVGVAFNVKMLEAFIVLPAFYLLYLVAAPLSWLKRIQHLILAGIVLLVVALSWPLAVDLTPPDQRPWVGGSQINSVLNLALGYNGLGRINGQEGRGGPGHGFQPNQGGFSGAGPQGQDGGNRDGRNNFPDVRPPANGNQGTPFFGGGPNPGGNRGGMFGAGVAGPLRLFAGELADQWSWLLPLTVAGLVAVVLGLRRKWPLEPRGQALLLWWGWLIIYGIVFSMAQGIFHTYYLIMLGPALAALVGISVAALWQAYRKGGWQAWLLPLALLGTALWESKILIAYPEWSQILVPIVLGGSLLAALPMLAARLFMQQGWRRLAPALLSVGLVAVFLAQGVWAISPVLAAGNGGMPQAEAPRLAGRTTGFNQRGSGPGEPGVANNGLVTYLEANQDGYFYLVAVLSANQASSIALETGKAVLAMGGFSGGDPAMTVEKLQQMVAGKQVRFILGGGNSEVNQWIQSNCTAVDANQYGGSTGNRFSGPGGFGGNSTLYNCSEK